MSATSPTIGVLDVDGLHLPDKGPSTNNVFAFRAVLRVIGGEI